MHLKCCEQRFGQMAEHFTLSINKLDFLLSFRTASTDSLCDGFQHPSQSLGREPRRPSRRIQKDLRLPDSSLPKGFKDRRVEAHKGNPTIAGAPGIASIQAHMARYVRSLTRCFLPAAWSSYTVISLFSFFW